MSPVALSTLLALAAASTRVLAQTETFTSGTPLASKHFSYPDGIPYQADSDNGVRGTQFGYNKCNSTTEGDSSLCQTAFLNHADDWCVWAPPKPGSTIGDTEQEEVAWCTKKGRGTRIIPAGAITGLQFMKTPGYLQIIGFIDQTKINLQPDDTGGELDPHGADFRGNPLGGLVYSNGFSSNNGNNGTFQQVIEWHNFMGSNSFCFKVCDPTDPRAPQLCQHIYDRIGVLYNCPNQAQNNVFESCEGDDQDPPGVFTSNGQVMTYTQPPESLGAITTMPYDPKIPASSNCVKFDSAALFTDLAAPTGSASTGTGAASPTQTGKTTGGSTASRSGASSSPSQTGAASGQNGASVMGVSVVSTVMGVLAAVAFLA